MDFAKHDGFLISSWTVPILFFSWKNTFLRMIKIHLTKVIHFPWKTRSSIIFLANLSVFFRPKIRFSIKKCHIAKNQENPPQTGILMDLAKNDGFLVSSWTVAVGMRLETKYFLRIGKIHLTKVIHFPWKTLSAIIFLANLSVLFCPKIRFSMKKCHIAKISGNPMIWLDLYRKSFDSFRNILKT